ncbi:MAG: amidohydrolase [Clostridia bacterium]|nr:amidohydrolase [Clostridia bacterium]
MLFRNISLVDENMSVRRNMYLGTRGGKIDYLSAHPPADEKAFGEIYPHSAHRLLVPGFVNAHTHTPMYLLRGYGENLKLRDWLYGKIFPFESRMSGHDAYIGAMCSIAEMLRFGTTSASDMYYFASDVVRGYCDAKMQGVVSYCTVCADKADYFALPAYKETAALLRNDVSNGLVRVEFALHAEYTTHESIARALAQAAKTSGSSIHVHVSETKDETEQCRRRRSMDSPVRYLEKCGIFDVPAVAAHCVWIDDEDMGILAEKGVCVASCPKSNLKLASGVSPAVKLLEKGVNVALGTDSAASNNCLNMLEEARVFALLHKGFNLDPTVISPASALYAATRAGALAQGRTDAGLLKEGFAADIAVFDTDREYMYPAHDLLSNLIFSACGSDVCLTMAGGRILYRDGEFTTLDVEKLRAEAELSVKQILSHL